MTHHFARPSGADRGGDRRGFQGDSSLHQEPVGADGKRSGHARLQCLRPGCGKTFSKSTHLLRHEAIHRGTNVRKCPLCEKSFSRPDSLRRHRHLVHGEEESSLASTSAAAEPVQQGCQNGHEPSDIVQRRRKTSDYSDVYDHGPSPTSEGQRSWYGAPTSSLRTGPEFAPFASGSNGAGRASVDLYESQQPSHNIASPISTLIHSSSPPQGLHLVAEAAVAAAAAGGPHHNSHKVARHAAHPSPLHQGPYQSHHADPDALPRSHFHDSRFPAPSLPMPHAPSPSAAEPMPHRSFHHHHAPPPPPAAAAPSHQHPQPSHGGPTAIETWSEQDHRQGSMAVQGLDHSSNPPVHTPASIGPPPSIDKLGSDFDLSDLNTGFGFVNGADWSLLNNVFLEANLLDVPTDTIGQSVLDHRALSVNPGGDGTRTPTEPKHIDTEETAAAVSKLRSLLTSAVEGKDLPQTPKRLANTMFRQFLAHFMPSMPAFHEGLFGRDGTSPGLLLTAISMGSLYVGSTEALTQGVSMWRLAGSAIWGACLFAGQTSTPRNLAELMRMCIIGHAFAIMGADRQIYQTARLVFPLAISAGHELGLFLRKKANSTCICPPELAGCQYIETAAQEDILQQLWRAWVREQEDRRVVIAVHVYDSQLSSFQGTPPLSQHFVLDVEEPDNDRLFAIDSARQWWSAIRLWETGERRLPSVSDYYECLFSKASGPIKRERDGANGATVTSQWEPKSIMTMYALLEGINSSVCLLRRRPQPGLPTTGELTWALKKWSEILTMIQHDDDDDREGASLHKSDPMCLWTRWHAVHLSLLVPSFEEVFDYLDRQLIGDPSHPVASFAHSEGHRRALIHAGSIWHLFNTSKRGLLVLPHVLHALYQATAVFLLAADYKMPIESGTSSYELLEPFQVGHTDHDLCKNAFVGSGGVALLNCLPIERDNRNIKDLLRTLDFVGGGDEGTRHVVFGRLRKIFFGSVSAHQQQQQQQSHHHHQQHHHHRHHQPQPPNSQVHRP